MTDKFDPPAVIIGDTRVVSRWGLDDELMRMTAFVLKVSATERSLIAEVFCDLKGYAIYLMKLRTEDEGSARCLAKKLEDHMISEAGGHNSIFVEYGKGVKEVHLGSTWPAMEADIMAQITAWETAEWGDARH